MPLSVVAPGPLGALIVRHPAQLDQVNPNVLAALPVPIMYVPTTSRESLMPKAMVEVARGKVSFLIWPLWRRRKPRVTPPWPVKKPTMSLRLLMPEADTLLAPGTLTRADQCVAMLNAYPW